MKKNVFTILGLSAAMLFQSCEKMLDIFPATTAPEEVLLTKVDGIDGGLNFAYSNIHTDFGRNFTLWSEAFADHLELRGSVLPTFRFFYERDLNAIISETVSATDMRVVSDVRIRDMYNTANTASLILRAVNKDLPKDDLAYASNKSRILGECYFLRAVSHFEMVRFWAKPWNATADNSHPGVVLLDEPIDDRVSTIKARASLRDTYAFIESDLLKAIEFLPDAFDPAQHSGVYNGRAVKDAARAYLVKVYYQQHADEKARSMINDLIGATPGQPSRHPLNASLTALFTARGPDNTDPESLYQTTSSITVNSLANWWNNSNTEAIYTRNNAAPKGIVTSQFLADAKFSGDDLRWKTFFKTLTDGNVTPIKYSLAEHFNLPLVRTAEMLLDRAQINADADRLQEAIDDCNAIRARAQIGLLPDNIAKAALLDSIRVERIRELAFEGDRLNNLRRMQVPIPAGDRSNQDPLPWDGLDLILKFSAEDMARNPLLTNNY